MNHNAYLQREPYSPAKISLKAKTAQKTPDNAFFSNSVWKPKNSSKAEK